MDEHAWGRRQIVAAIVGTVLAGCLGDGADAGEDEDDATADDQAEDGVEEDDGDEEEHGDDDRTPPAEVTRYLVAFNWGFALFDPAGNEHELIEIEVGSPLEIHAVNILATDAIETLPDPVADELEDFDPLARTKAKVEEGDLPEPEGATVEEVYEEALGDGEGSHHLDHGIFFEWLGVSAMLPVDATEPATESVIPEEAGVHIGRCTVPCGEYHNEHKEELIRVTENG